MSDMEQAQPSAEYGHLALKNSHQHRLASTRRRKVIRRRDILIICLLILVLILTLCCIALSVSLIAERTPSKYSVCMTSQCLIDAARIKNGLDESEDPCEDFYSFACHGWIRDNPAPPNMTEWTVMHVMSDTTREHARQILEDRLRNAADHSAEKKLKDFYHSCVFNRDKEQTMLVLMRHLSKIGQWSPPHSDITYLPPSWSLLEALKASHFDMEAHPLFFAGNRLYGDPEEGPVTGPFIELSPNKGCMAGSRDYQMDKYTAYVADIARLLGVPESNIVQFMDGVLFIGELLCKHEETQEKASDVYYDHHDAPNVHDNDTSNPGSPVQEFMTVNDLQTLAPQIQWVELLRYRFKDLTENTTILVTFKLYFQHLAQVLATPDPRALRNFLLLRSVEPFIDALPEEFAHVRDRFIVTGTSPAPSMARWEYCMTRRVDSVMRFALAHVMKDKQETSPMYKKVQAIVKQIREAFYERLQTLTWLDNETKHDVSKKMAEMRAMLGSPEWIENRSLIDEIYSKLDIDWTATYLENDIRAEKFQATEYIPALMRLIDLSSQPGVEDPLTPQAYQTPGKISITHAIMQPPIFHQDSIPYLNYGSIGSIIGHEFAHAFDGHGGINYITWYTQESLENFRQRIECLKDYFYTTSYMSIQFSVNYSREHLPVPQITADAAGIKWAFQAFKRWSRDDARALQKLPTLDYTPDQLFFINLVQGECQSAYPKETTFPLGFRMMGLMAQSGYFAEAFRCPAKSKLRLDKVCDYW